MISSHCRYGLSGMALAELKEGDARPLLQHQHHHKRQHCRTPVGRLCPRRHWPECLILDALHDGYERCVHGDQHEDGHRHGRAQQLLLDGATVLQLVGGGGEEAHHREAAVDDLGRGAAELHGIEKADGLGLRHRARHVLGLLDVLGRGVGGAGARAQLLHGGAFAGAVRPGSACLMSIAAAGARGGQQTTAGTQGGAARREPRASPLRPGTAERRV
mmetsp:Transcript_15706/g.39937  ORF Transcript_15706/g.39937 Transcript_15706/m.39937 type:complete len:217 (+) Transcript_15706:82-732(+)